MNLGRILADERLPRRYGDIVERFWKPLASHIASAARNRPAPLTVGLNGAPGSGKSTLARVLEQLLEEQWGLRTARLSLDDLYLTRGQRRRLAIRVHPLFATRGVPGTHDINLGLETFDSICRGGSTVLPRFSKAADNRLPRRIWPVVDRPLDIFLFEGWCVGATPQSESELETPVNVLERFRDPEGIWRRHVNLCLAGNYTQLFERIDLLVSLCAPNFEQVVGWRLLQERKLRRSHWKPTDRTMSDAQVRTFVMHFERLTRHMLGTMPNQADVLVSLDRRQGVRGIAERSA